MSVISAMNVVPACNITRAVREDLPAISALLRSAELPDEDIAPHLEHFLVARGNGAVVGAIGAQVNGADALLRSAVVATEHRGTGLGGRLLAALDAAAANWGVQRWWLLTTTAQRFFSARGFVVAPRAAAPRMIQHTGQFSGGCCSRAVCMTRERRIVG